MLSEDSRSLRSFTSFDSSSSTKPKIYMTTTTTTTASSYLNPGSLLAPVQTSTYHVKLTTIQPGSLLSAPARDVQGGGTTRPDSPDVVVEPPLEIRGFEFCRTHGMEDCVACGVDHKTQNNQSDLIFELALRDLAVKEEEMENLMDFLETRKGFDLTKLNARRIQSGPDPGSSYFICNDHDLSDCSLCFDFKKAMKPKIMAFIRSKRLGEQRSTIVGAGLG